MLNDIDIDRRIEILSTEDLENTFSRTGDVLLLWALAPYKMQRRVVSELLELRQQNQELKRIMEQST